MQIEIKRIQTEVGITFIHVTHDQEEAMTMADTIAVMNQGVIEQMGAPEDLYELPRTTFVSNFLGQSNLIRGSVTDDNGNDLVVGVKGTALDALGSRCASRDGEVWVGIRPEKVQLSAAGDRGTGGDVTRLNVLPGGTVTDVSFIGVSTQYLVRMPWGQELAVFEQNTGTHGVFKPGDAVDLQWRPEHTFLLDAFQDAMAGAELEDAPA
jgi:spermidine/putrescine transport system ATP-binding protein